MKNSGKRHMRELLCFGVKRAGRYCYMAKKACERGKGVMSARDWTGTGVEPVQTETEQ